MVSIKKGALLCSVAAIYIGLQFGNIAKGSSTGCQNCAVCNGQCTINNKKIAATQTMTLETNPKFYNSIKNQLMEEFNVYSGFMKKELIKNYGSKKADILMNQIKNQYASLIPKIPYIGGEKNTLTENLVSGTVFLSAYKVLKPYKMSVDKIGKMAYSVVTTAFDTYYTKAEKLRMGKQQFSKEYLDSLKAAAIQSQAKKYSGDWVYTLSNVDLKNSKYTINYTQCGIVKFFHEQNADEFTPYMCKLDFAISDECGLGLKRTGTIADGNKQCDFNYNYTGK
jgi:hypothetical protein